MRIDYHVHVGNNDMSGTASLVQLPALILSVDAFVNDGVNAGGRTKNAIMCLAQAAIERRVDAKFRGTMAGTELAASHILNKYTKRPILQLSTRGTEKKMACTHTRTQCMNVTYMHERNCRIACVGVFRRNPPRYWHMVGTI
jgi:hypothetical protein